MEGHHSLSVDERSGSKPQLKFGEKKSRKSSSRKKWFLRLFLCLKQKFETQLIIVFDCKDICTPCDRDRAHASRYSTTVKFSRCWDSMSPGQTPEKSWQYY